MIGVWHATVVTPGRNFLATVRATLTRTLIAFAATSIAFWALSVWSAPGWMLPVLYVWAGVYGVLLPAQVWTLANYVSDLPSFPTPPELQYVKWQFRTAFPTLRTACNNTKLPAQFPLAPQSVTGSSAQLAGMLRAGSGSYYVMQQAPSTPGFTLLFSTSSGTALRTSLVPQLAVLRLQ